MDLPETARRDEQELELLVSLGPALVTTQGYSTPEIGETYARALTLSRRLGETKHILSALSGSWLFHVVGGQLEESRKFAQQCLDAAGGEAGPALSTAGHFLLGSSLFHLGRLELSREHLNHALAAYAGPPHSALSLFAGPDLGVFCRSYLAQVFWLTGRIQEIPSPPSDAITLARELSHPFSLAIALDYTAMLHVFREEAQAALDRAEEAAAVCRKHGFAYYLAWADIVAGWATARVGETALGLAKLRHGLDALKAMGAELRLPLYYGLLAEVCGLAGQEGEALASLSSAFAFQSKNEEVWFSPELHRIYGDLLLRSGNEAEAQVHYQRAIEAARQTGATMFERRASERMRLKHRNAHSPRA